jgi:DNA-binding NarL/FixJ family response regulator
MIRVLIVDNNITRAGLTSRAVRRLNFGARVNYALSAVQALFYVAGVLADRRKTLPDIIVLAEPLPETRGVDALKAITQAVGAHPVSIVVVRDADEPADAVEYYKNGAAAYVARRSTEADYQNCVADAVCFTAMVMGLVPKQPRFLSPEQYRQPTIGEILQVYI